MAALYNAVCKSLCNSPLFLTNFKPNRCVSTNSNTTRNKSHEIPSDGCGTVSCGERKERTGMTRLMVAIPFQNAPKNKDRKEMRL